jgi:TOMM system kinase/cyclase fusion protein
MPNAGDTIEPGTTFAGYDVLEELGAGSFGRVLKARQRSTGQDVAIKILRLEHHDTPADTENHLRRLRREMRVCATLSHPHIVRLIDSGEAPGAPLYVVFEYAPGATLRDILEREGKLEPAEAFRLMIQVLDALSSAHARGIVHRDVKPENIMVTQTGVRRNAMVLDFGLGGFVTGASQREQERLTGSGEMMGTPSYAAPEQLRGAPPSADSDLYSWGLILLECLTGEMAMSGRTAYDVLMKQLGPDPIEIPAWLEQQRPGRLLRIVTAKDPAQRQIPVSALIEALEEIQRDVTRGQGIVPQVISSEGERRQLTVVCCAARVSGGDVELEDLDHVLKAHEALCRHIAAEAGGTTIRAGPGEVQVTFGYPRVRENDARLAVRMALRIRTESRALGAEIAGQHGLQLQTRLGVHSGLGIVRRASTQSRDGAYEIVGTPPQVAARLVEDAGPDELLVTLDTRSLLREEMECEPVREIEVAGQATPVPVFRIVCHRPAALLETFGRANETPLVGRAGELGQLKELWRRAEAGEARVVFIQGEAGIGKSRLVRELRGVVPREGWLSCRCVPEGQASALHPAVEWLRSLTEPIDRLLARYHFNVAENLPLLARLLEVSVGDPKATAVSPERQRERTLWLLVSLFTRMASVRPLAFVIEDLHWADPTTLEFLRALVDEVAAIHSAPPADGPRLLVLVTARPEFSPTWAAEEVNVLSLKRLSRSEVAEMVSAVPSPDGPAAAEVVSQIVDRSDGVPLFVEEMVEVLDEADRSGSASGHVVPATLWELLDARLDVLSATAREVVQFAAALGREFRYDLLLAALGRDEWLVRQDIVELLDARLLFGRRGAVHERYVFRHALVRDAAHESMVRTTRQRVHRRIADAIQTHFAARGAQQPELIALHLESGGELAAAAEWWQRAGDRAFRHAAYTEAAQHLERGLGVLAHMPEGAARVQREIETLIILGTVLLSTRGHADPEVQQAFSRARQLSEEHGVEVSLKILANLVAALLMEGGREAAEAFLPRFERLATGSEDPVTRLSGLLPVSLHAFWRGEHVRAAGLLEESCSLYRTEDFQRYAEEYGWDGGHYAYGYSVWNRWIMGDAAGAETLYEKLITIAQSSFDPQALPLALTFGMATAHGRRDVAAALERAERLMAIATEQRLFLLVAIGQCGHGLGVALGGDTTGGIAELMQGLMLIRMSGARTLTSYYLTYLAEAQHAAGQAEEGLASAQEGLALCQQDLGRMHEPELLRLEGELLRTQGDSAAAQDRLRRAIRLARGGGAAMWELRAALSLARMLGAGGADERRAVLAAASERFARTQDGPDIRAVRELLS